MHKKRITTKKANNYKESLSVTPINSNLVTDAEVKDKFDEKYERKLKRRKIKEEFLELVQSHGPSIEKLLNLIKCNIEITPLLREALAEYKYCDDPWSIELWHFLKLDEASLRARIEELGEVNILHIKQFFVDVHYHLPKPLLVKVSLKSEGPDWKSITPESIIKLIYKHVQRTTVEFHLVGSFPLTECQIYPIQLIFKSGESITIDIQVNFDEEKFPLESLHPFYKSTLSQTVMARSVVEKVVEILQGDSRMEGRVLTDTYFVLKEAYIKGFHKNEYVQRLLSKYREGWKIESEHIRISNLPPKEKEEYLKSQLEKKFRPILEIWKATLPSLRPAPHWNVDYFQKDDDDERISKLWMENHLQSFADSTNQEIRDQTLAKMLSARIAEKAAANFYRSIGFRVQDISITQLDAQSSDWKYYDLLVENDRESLPIDVKNARNPYGENPGYVEHCIPRFKTIRIGDQTRDVIIGGVLSPYLRLEEFSSYSPWNMFKSINFLGETTKDKIINFEKEFTSDVFRLEVINYGTIPPWVFDYPTVWYQGCNNSRALIRKTEIDQFPTPEEAKLLGINLIPTFLICGIQLPNQWARTLNSWQLALYKRLLTVAQSGFQLGRIFLTILTHFVEMAKGKSDSEKYSPTGYRGLFFPNNQIDYYVLGVYDPLSLIKNLCDTLISLWDFVEKGLISLREFISFRFLGLGILQGLSGGNSWKTVIAYCGGTVETARNVKCGRSPLIIGRERSCSCGKLICSDSKCDFCSENCRDRLARRRQRVHL